MSIKPQDDRLGNSAPRDPGTLCATCRWGRPNKMAPKFGMVVCGHPVSAGLMSIVAQLVETGNVPAVVERLRFWSSATLHPVDACAIHEPLPPAEPARVPIGTPAARVMA